MTHLTPTFSHFFKSFYYSNTYLPPVDLSEQGLSKHLLKSQHPDAARKIQQLISHPEVQSVLSEPLTYDRKEIEKNNKILEQYGFKLLSSKPLLENYVLKKTPFYSVIEHKEAESWIIKSGATRIAKDQLAIGPFNEKNEMAFFTKEEGLLRIEMANRIAKVAHKAKIDAILPKKKLVAYAKLDGITEANKKYCVVCEKIDILSVDDTAKTIMKMSGQQQKELARKISTIIQKAGIVDASIDNIRLTPDGKPAFIDTEPAGLMVAKKPGLWNKLCGAKGASVEKCARIGLYTLMDQTAPGQMGFDHGLKGFHEQIKSDYEKISTPKLSKWKIGLSVASIGLIPLINAIVALVKTKLTKQTYKKLMSMQAIFQKAQGSKTPDEQNRLTEEFKKNYFPIAKKFYSYIDGVPYS